MARRSSQRDHPASFVPLPLCPARSTIGPLPPPVGFNPTGGAVRFLTGKRSIPGVESIQSRGEIYFFPGGSASGIVWTPGEIGFDSIHPATSRCAVPYVLIIHEVADYPAWKRVFDAAAGLRRDAGERSYQVLRYQNDPNRIVHFSVWTSLEEARRFFESPQLIRIRADAGVKSPEFIYLDQLEAGTT